MYTPFEVGYPAEKVEQPELDPLAASRYSCIYWVDHLYVWNPNTSINHSAELQDGSAIDSFLIN
ncbi:hypothetical protein GQ43DRAFT_128485 [Delitschia confertaspora ATCC 74209]|uniref:Uncharacterized protein n=1 Tax=Delitschia confertaspora ATCC 74209 TaxID=1513339 RepID=A0A9P4JT63_9PLEO|nr:hypothetical protein GQ43DRAFT_128485 [Delitschia confertaspora ATCC 74209]